MSSIHKTLWMINSQHTAVFYPISNHSKPGSEDVTRKKLSWKKGLDFKVQWVSKKLNHLSIWVIFFPMFHFSRNSASLLPYGLISRAMCRLSLLLGQESVHSLLTCLKHATSPPHLLDGKLLCHAVDQNPWQHNCTGLSSLSFISQKCWLHAHTCLFSWFGKSILQWRWPVSMMPRICL